MNPLRSVSGPLFPFRLAGMLFVVLGVLAAVPAARAQGVKDSVRVSFDPEWWFTVTLEGKGLECGSHVRGLHPDFAPKIGNSFPSYSYAPNISGFSYWAANDTVANPKGMRRGRQRGSWGAGPYSGDAVAACGQNLALYAAYAASLTQWAIYTYPDGTPVAKFDTSGTGLARRFDGAASFEAESGRRVPVVGYRWTFGDGSGEATGVAPAHTYAQEGRYLVTLEVTDNDGQKDRYSRHVTVVKPGLRVWAEALDADQTFRKGDAIAVVAYVENRSTEEITDVRVPLSTGMATVYPAHAEPFYKQPAQYRPLGARPDTTIAFLAPGERAEIDLYMSLADYAHATLENTYVAIEATGHAMLLGVTGKDAQGKAVEVEQKCGFMPCGNTWKAAPRVYAFEMTLSAASHDGLVAREVSAVPSGLIAGPSGALAVVARHRIRTADLSERVCRSGCVEVEVVVKDEQGQPAKNFEVTLSAPAVPITAGFGAVTPGQTGRFCDPDPAGDGTRCGTTLSGVTDADGRLRSVYLTPGVVSDVPVTLTAKPAQPDDVGRAERTLTVQPTLLRETTLAVNEETSRALMAALAVRGFSDNAQKLAELPATFCKAIGTTFGSTTSLLAAPVVDLSFLGDLPADALDWGCGELPSAPFPTVLTLGKPFGELVPLVWMLESTQLPGIGLAKIDKKVAPPFVQVRDDFTPFVSDALVAIARANPAASQLSPLDLLRGQGVEVKITEVSALTDLATDLAQTEKSTYGLYVTLGGETKLVAAGYDARLWLQEASLLQSRPQTSAAANAGDTQISATAPSTRAADGAEADGPAAAGSTDAADGAAAGPLAEGDLVTLGAGLPTAEVVQVRDVQGATVRLTTPLRHGHAAGEVLRIVARRAVGMPERPVPFAPYDGTMATARPVLRWSMLAPATNFDVQVAHDTVFAAPLVQEHAALRADSLRLSGLADGQHYAWRVRARSELGVGDWSRPRTFVASAPVAVDESVAASLPAGTTLAPPTPNPASAGASVAFALPVAGTVRLSVYDLLGREVAVLVDETRAAGRHAASLSVSALPVGMYVVRLVAGRESRTQRLVVVR